MSEYMGHDVQFGLLVACLFVNYMHTGCSNKFEISVFSDAAILYNDIAVRIYLYSQSRTTLPPDP